MRCLYSRLCSSLFKQKIKCVECLGACTTIPINDQNVHSRIALITKKSRGGLTIPSDNVVTVCTATEASFRRACNINMGRPPPEENFPAVLTLAIINQLLLSNKVFADLQDHDINMSVPGEFNSHKLKLVKAII